VILTGDDAFKDVRFTGRSYVGQRIVEPFMIATSGRLVGECRPETFHFR
jgi:hypothetical protein